MGRPIYIFAGGGTGGHLIPALAIAEELSALRPEARIVFACSDRQIDRRILSPTPHAIVPQPARPLPRGLRGWAGFLRARIASGRLARDMVRSLQPAAVLGLGGFAAAAAVQAAHSAGVRTALMSIDAVPGLANRHLARRVEVVFAQFERTAACYGPRGGKVRVVGCPVRRALQEAAPAEARSHFGLRDDRKTLAVITGSLGAANINEAVAGMAGELDGLAGEWQVLHVTGPGKAESVRAAWGGAKIARVVREFCDRMDLAYAAADLMVCRAGAATIGELAATATPAVLMPYPYHRDRQQDHNAAPLAAAGAAVVVPDLANAAENARNLGAALLAVMPDPHRLEAMRAAAGRVFRPGAAGEIARWLVG